MKKIPSIDDIRKNILSKINTEIYSNKADNMMLERSIWNIWATVFAGALRSIYEYVRYMYNQIFTNTADAESLELKGEQYGIYKKKGTQTVLSVTLKGDIGAEIPANTQLIYLDYIFLTNNSVVVGVLGEARVDATAISIGANTVLQKGTELNFVSPIAGVNTIATVFSIIVRGEDIESIEDYRNRVSIFEKQRPQGGAIPDFILWTLEVSEIVDAMVEPLIREYAPVVVYPISNIITGNRIPTPEKIEEVQKYLDDPVRKPPCIVEVKAPKELIFDIVVDEISPNTDDGKNALKLIWQDYLYSKRPKQYTDQIVDNLIQVSNLTTVALNNGIVDVVIKKITIRNAIDEVTPYSLKIGELAILGNITYE